jgi:AcrR family transcriptional regulator
VTAHDELSVAHVARPRTRERRQHLLDAARDLLRERGWHSVAIGDIGAAAGISGPAVYRHFKNKEELLVAALQHAADLLWSALPEGGAGVPQELLRAYVDSHARFVVENTDLVELWYQESRHLPEPARSAQRRLQRRYVERWIDVLLECRPELSQEEARIMVRGAIGTLHSVVHSDRIYDEERLGEVLGDMIMAALLTAGGKTRRPALRDVPATHADDQHDAVSGRA